VTGNGHPGINCGDRSLEHFKEGTYDYIISTLALFGPSLKTAFQALKPGGGGNFSLLSGVNIIPLLNHALEKSNIICKQFSWNSQLDEDDSDGDEEEVDDEEEKRRNDFLAKNMALSCKKLKKFRMKNLERNLNEFKRKNEGDSSNKHHSSDTSETKK